MWSACDLNGIHYKCIRLLMECTYAVPSIYSRIRHHSRSRLSTYKHAFEEIKKVFALKEISILWEQTRIHSAYSEGVRIARVDCTWCIMCNKCLNVRVLCEEDCRCRSTPCPAVRQGDEWSDPGACELADDCQYCHTRTEQQFHPEVHTASLPFLF